jgi:hypothetical protein
VAELATLDILWTTGTATVREVHTALSSTVLWQMQVMAERPASASAPTSTERASPGSRPSGSEPATSSSGSFLRFESKRFYIAEDKGDGVDAVYIPRRLKGKEG